MRARFVHVNLIARDWRRLADFYVRVFGCEPVPPPRRQAGDWLSRGTGVVDAALEGVHLRLPGAVGGGPTLEIYTYAETLEPGAPVAAVEVSWGSPMLLHKMLDRSLPLDQIPAPFDKMARDAVGSAHALLDEVKGDAVIGLYLSKSGKVALVLAAEVANPGAAKGQLRTLTGSLAAALEGYRELAGGAKDAAFKVTLAQDGGRLGSDKVDLLAVSVPKNMEQEAAKAAYALSKKKELEILAGVRDQVAILAIGGGAAEVFADKKAGT
ncbi:MAG: hypothetical protein KC420_03050, partial [Myxococcales bacterium]|nr:hypothetical protein [Myxococcales bacterium]